MKIEFTDFIILFLICYIHNEYKIFIPVLHNNINNEAFKLVPFRLLGQSNIESYDGTNLEKTFILHADEKGNKLGSHNICAKPELIEDLRVYKSKANKDAHNELKSGKKSKKKNNIELKHQIKEDELIKEYPLNDKNEDDKILDKEEINRQNLNNSKSDYLNSNKQHQKVYNKEVKLLDEEIEDIPEALNDLLDDKVANIKSLIEEILKKEFKRIKKRLDTLLKKDLEDCELIKNKILENQIEKANMLRDKLLEDKTICKKLKIEEIDSIESLENSINNMGIRNRTKLKIKNLIQNYMDIDDSFEQVEIYNRIKKYIKNDINPGVFRKIIHTLKIQEGFDAIGKSKYYHKIAHSPLLLYIRRYVIFDVIVFVGTSQLMTNAPMAIPIIISSLVVLFLIVRYGGNVIEFFQKLAQNKKKNKKMHRKR
ncbi:Plasmodium exported protein, unknown function [Plasmodium chabaudi chabaudi]|uniref:Uncharacterized protein n=1 Tax=Plasmodium chabaudi chabaudi TaxID=31271 RepID=A0A1D3RX67_PLACU|nr:Plasmodium exported protein, unknown function [Plasmodium chabaudi chabaudi]